ncbi:hypothetical protein [Streptomyces sp. NPDC002082]|uniref:hypothetical protein n=1 Tax=Streptomyces sp. NPDC002082 TaxID=3154772 RepID=UPI003326D20A
MAPATDERRIVAAIPGGGYVFNEKVGDKTAPTPVLCWLVYDGDLQVVDCLGDHLTGTVTGLFEDWPAFQVPPVKGHHLSTGTATAG